ncbi:hypothetical protein [Haloarcula sebkhae]|uniref:Uncharacterized protein n=2 Tax=Haloarcula sebkhae TaxID=932660 RepID=A0A830ENI2_9EURY|nr:hypothetical protein [Haloarcula sebkhae]GGK79455.1 hypothetical protein GCM10009067_34710 [Haloarcula sebkhae]
MDPRNTPGYRMHRALTKLDRLEAAGLDEADRERIETARTHLQNVSLLSHPERQEEAAVHAES